MRPRPPAPAPHVPFHRLERLIRHPACPLSCAAAAAGLAFMLVSSRALPLLGGILATLVIGCVGPWIAVCGATAVIAWDRRRCRVGDTLAATITWRSILPWWRPRVTLRWPDSATGTGSPVGSTAMSTAATGSVAVAPRRRGRFPRIAPAIESNRPFGIVTARRAVAMPAPVIAWPARADVRVPAGLVAAAGIGRDMSARNSGHSGDSIGARDYRTGDSVRSIHWAHTARRDALVVRERPGTAAAAVRIVVDHRIHRHASESSTGADAETDRTLDAFVGIAFAIVESWRPRGVTCELLWPGRAPLGPRAPADVTAMLDELACLEPRAAADIEPPSPSGRLRPMDLEILLTTPPGRETLAAAVGLAASPRHGRLWILVGDGSATTAARIGRGRGEMVVHVPLAPDPVAAVDAAFASLNPDPDTRPRRQKAGGRRSHAPA